MEPTKEMLAAEQDRQTHLYVGQKLLGHVKVTQDERLLQEAIRNIILGSHAGRIGT
jgi:hypothetical protein